MSRLFRNGVAAMAVALCVASCGGSAEDALTLSFQGWSDEGLQGGDPIRDATAEVDLCPSLCGSDFGPVFNTSAVATFENKGFSDITMVEYTVSVPGSGIADQTRGAARVIPGRGSASMEILLFDFEFKTLIQGLTGDCQLFVTETGVPVAVGVDQSVTLPIIVTFRGLDDSNERFTVSAELTGVFTEYNVCG